MVTTPPVRTVTVTSGTTGGCWVAEASIGLTRISPVASSAPLEIVYGTVTGPSSVRVEEIRTSWWPSTATSRPLPSGTSTDWSTSTPPAGSTSLASGSTTTSPPDGSRATSSTAIGGSGVSGRSATSIRAMPVVCCGEAVTTKLT